jgi:two-component system, OmpR family, response regulator ChvI
VTSGSLSHQVGKKKILAVDDELDMTTILKMVLERVGYIVDIFNDPVLALERFKPNLYDLVVLDIMMPRMNGFQLYEQLKKMDHDVKVCFLTASSETYREKLRKEEYHELNKDLFLEMPLPVKEIIEEIKKRIE